MAAAAATTKSREKLGNAPWGREREREKEGAAGWPRAGPRRKIPVHTRAPVFSNFRILLTTVMRNKTVCCTLSPVTIV